MAKETNTPKTAQAEGDPFTAFRLSFYHNPELLDRSRNDDHMDLLVDAEMARVIQENIPEDATDDERDWARTNALHAKNVLYAFEDNGYRHPEPAGPADSPESP